MALITGYASVLNTEVEWLVADLSGDGLPPLIIDQGGPFGAVGAQVRRLDQARHQLWLTHNRTTQPHGSKTDHRLDHEVAAVILWTATGGGPRAHIDQTGLDAAVEALLLRIAGAKDDPTHGGRWWNVGPATVNPPTPLQLLVWTDALAAAGAAHVVVVTWTVTEWR